MTTAATAIASPRTVASPWIDVDPLAPSDHRDLVEQAIFQCGKWDPQVGDVSVLAPYPLVLRAEAWQTVARLAERLASELDAAEAALLDRPDRLKRLALPRSIRRTLAGAGRRNASPGPSRVIRFDFHWTADGWRISEANCDVPGGFNEASGLTRRVAAYYAGYAPTGDPVERMADEIVAVAGPGARVALVHATAYSDDRQVVAYLARRWAERGLDAVEVAPDHLRWDHGTARLVEPWPQQPLDLVYRFFPAEWLPDLPRSCRWRHYFAGSRTPMVNPGSALVVQSKRLPLAWDGLPVAFPTWRQLLPETVDPASLGERWDASWVLKPAFGRVGDGVGMDGATPPGEWALIRRSARRHPEFWVAQRRFDTLPLCRQGRLVYPCLGVYTVGGGAAGAYGRLSSTPRIDQHATEAAVLVEPSSAAQTHGGHLP